MPSIEIIIFLLLAAFLAGWVDAIGGGGGLIHFPALLFGLPNATPAELLGTNKAAQVLGTASASITYFQKKDSGLSDTLIDWEKAFIIPIYTLLIFRMLYIY